MIRTTNLHILIAEDDEDDRDVMHDCFTNNSNFSKVDLVRNGRELLDFLRSATAPIPDVILTDINMPVMDGIRALEVINADDQLRDIATFVYSTSINPAYEARCRELGIREFLIKPFDLDAFDLIPAKIVSALEE